MADGDPAAWAAAIERVAGDLAVRQKMGRAAAQFVADVMSLEAVADRLVYLYSMIAGVNSRSR